MSWNRVVLDVAPEATNIAFGILLHGSGAVWLDDVKFEVVGKDVPTTGMAAGDAIRERPENLSFEN